MITRWSDGIEHSVCWESHDEATFEAGLMTAHTASYGTNGDGMVELAVYVPSGPGCGTYCQPENAHIIQRVDVKPDPPNTEPRITGKYRCDRLLVIGPADWHVSQVYAMCRRTESAWATGCERDDDRCIQLTEAQRRHALRDDQAVLRDDVRRNIALRLDEDLALHCDEASLAELATEAGLWNDYVRAYGTA